MANRSYLFTFDRFDDKLPSKPRGVHYWSSQIPLAQLLLVSAKPRAYASSLYDEKIAVVADFEPGLARLRGFLYALSASGAMVEPELFAAAVSATEAFFAQPANHGRFALLEPMEIFWFEETAHDVQHARLLKQIASLARVVDERVAGGPDLLFAKPPRWLADLRAGWTMDLALEWTNLLPVSLGG